MSDTPDNYLSLAGFSKEFRLGFWLGRNGGVPSANSGQDVHQGFAVGTRYANKPEWYALDELRKAYTVDPVNAEALRIQAEQHRKGMETYHISLYHADLPILELLDHAIQEGADRQNYLIALRMKLAKMLEEAQP